MEVCRSVAAAETVVSKTGAVYLLFGRSGCGVCVSVRESVGRIAEACAVESGCYADVEDVPALCGRLMVFSVPTLVVFRGGAEVGRVSGFFHGDAVRRLFEAATDG